MSSANDTLRFVALDLHKRYVMVGAVNARQEVVLRPQRVELVAFEGWARKHLRPTDEVVLEATSNAWYIYDLLQPLVVRVVVANPYAVKLIAASLVKTDRRDTLVLARLLAANLIPEVWVPPAHVRELRALIAHRERLVSQQTATKNRLHGVLHRHQLVPPEGGLFSTANRTWWNGLNLLPSEKLRVQQDLATLDHLAPHLVAVETELARLSTLDPWISQVPFLIQLPGIGLIIAMTILSAIGDISRFPSAKKLVGYAGLGARVHASGQTHHSGGITKQGRRELRAAMVEAAWVAVDTHPFWRQRFAQLTARMGKQKAIVAIARKLLVVVWHVLTQQQADRQADPEKVARYFLSWGRQLGAELRQGQPTATFARQQLDKVGLGQELQQVYLGYAYKLPPSRLAQPAPETPSPAASG
jgi:transposase